MGTEIMRIYKEEIKKGFTENSAQKLIGMRKLS